MLWALQLVVGSVVCVLVWRTTRDLPSAAAKAWLRAAPVALTFAPGLGIGHGVLFPTGLALLIDALTPAAPSMPADFAVFSILAAWVLVALGLFIKYRFYDPRRSSKTGP